MPGQCQLQRPMRAGAERTEAARVSEPQLECGPIWSEEDGWVLRGPRLESYLLVEKRGRIIPGPWPIIIITKYDKKLYEDLLGQEEDATIFDAAVARGALSAKVIGLKDFSLNRSVGFCAGKFQQVSAAMSSEGSPSVDVATVAIEVSGKRVEIAGIPAMPQTVIRTAIASTPFQQWLKSMRGPNGILTLGDKSGTRCSLNGVTIQSVDMFGKRVGFVKFKAEVVDEATGAKLPGIVFARGGAVSVLMLLECEGEKYAVLTEQARVPVGRAIFELPAGMLDDNAGDFVGTAAREVEEETGIHLKSSDLINLTSLLEEATGQKMFPSPGGCDEEITLLLYRGHVSKEVLESLQGQQKGLVEHGELIKVHVVPYKKLWRLTADAKALAAIAIYEMAAKEGILPEAPNAPELSSL